MLSEIDPITMQDIEAVIKKSLRNTVVTPTILRQRCEAIGEFMQVKCLIPVHIKF